MFQNDAKPRTIQDALAAGETELCIACRSCRFMVAREFVDMPGLFGETPLASLPGRLVCRRCGNRPAAEDVWTRIPDRMWDGRSAYQPSPPRDPLAAAEAPPAPEGRRWKTRHRRLF